MELERHFKTVKTARAMLKPWQSLVMLQLGVLYLSAMDVFNSL